MPSRKKLPDNNTKDRMMLGFGGELREGKAVAHRCGGTCDRQTTQGMIGAWVKAKGIQVGGSPSQETEKASFMRRGLQQLAVEDGGWRVRMTSRWASLCTRRGGGEQVKKIELQR